MNIKMFSTEILVRYQGRVQHLTKIIENKAYYISDGHREGNLTNGLLDAFRTFVRMTILSIDGLPYHVLISKFQELTREEVGDQKMKMEFKRRTGSSSSAMLATVEKSY